MDLVPHQPEVFLRDLEQVSDEAEERVYPAILAYLAVRGEDRPREDDEDDTALALFLRSSVTGFTVAVVELMTRHSLGAVIEDDTALRAQAVDRGMETAVAAFADASSADVSDFLSGTADERRATWLRHVTSSVVTSVRSTVQEFVARELGLRTKTWHTRLDERVRRAHRLLEGRTVPLGQRFITIGGTLRYPGDRSAPIELWINCRCALSFGT